MVDLTSMASAASGLIQAGQIVQSLIGLKVQSEVSAKIIDLQSAIMTAQAGALAAQGEMQALANEIDRLKAKIAANDNWENEIARYELKQFELGPVVYVLRTEHAAQEPEHMLCPDCIQQRKKSILQVVGNHGGGLTARCHPCGVTLKLRKHPIPAVQSSRTSYY